MQLQRAGPRFLACLSPGVIASAFGLSLAMISTNCIVLLEHDAFYQAQMTRMILARDLDVLAMAWPPGLALLAAPISVVFGLHPAQALLTVNILAFIALCVSLDKLLKRNGTTRGTRTLLVAAFASLGPWSQALFRPMTEVLFILASVGLASGIARLNFGGYGLILTLASVLAAFLVRYVGGVYSALVFAYVLFKRSLPKRRRLLAASAAMLALCAACLVLHVRMIPGHRVREGLIMGPIEAMGTLGYDLVLCAGSDLLARVPTRHDETLRTAAGVAVLGSCMGVMFVVARRSTVAFSTWLTAATYGGAMIASFMLVDITDVNSPRMGLPLLALALIVVGPAFDRHKRLRVLLVLTMAVGIAVALHQNGRSRAYVEPIRQAEPYLRNLAQSNKTIGLNLNGLPVTSKLSGDFRYVWSPQHLEESVPEAEYVVLVKHRSVGRQLMGRSQYGIDPPWADTFENAKLPGFELLTATPILVAFQRQ